MDERTSDGTAAGMAGAAPPQGPAREGAGAPALGAPAKVRLGSALILAKVRYLKLLEE